MPTADSSSPEASDYAVKPKRIMQSFEHTPAFDPSHVLKKSLFKYEDAQVFKLSEELATQLVEWLKTELAKKEAHNAEHKKGFICRLAEFSAELPDRTTAEEKTEGFHSEGSGI